MSAGSAAPAGTPGVGPGEPGLVWRVTEQGKPLGTLVIDRLIAGRSCGGLCGVAAVSTEELGALAATMTLKFAFLGIACGGGKAGLVLPPRVAPEERRRRARAFGHALAPLVRFGTYVPGTDLGSDEVDLWEVRTGAGISAGPAPTSVTEGGSVTAGYSGQSGAVAALVALARAGRSAAEATLAVAGYGWVGAAFARRFVRAGGRVVAVSTASGGVADAHGLDLARLEALRSRHGDAAPLRYAESGGRRVDPEQVLAIPVDVLAPCATAHMIAGRASGRVRCRVLSPGANAALTFEAEEGLAAAGVTVLPDFVTSAGGVLVSHFWPLDPPPAAADALIDGCFRRLVEGLLRSAEAAGTPPAAFARVCAREHGEQLAAAGAAARRRAGTNACSGRSDGARSASSSRPPAAPGSSYGSPGGSGPRSPPSPDRSQRSVYACTCGPEYRHTRSVPQKPGG